MKPRLSDDMKSPFCSKMIRDKPDVKLSRPLVLIVGRHALPVAGGKFDAQIDESNASKAGSYYAGRLYRSQTTSHGIVHEERTCLVEKADNRDISQRAGEAALVQRSHQLAF